MKKLISILLSAVMLITTVVFSTAWAEETSNKIVDLDFSKLNINNNSGLDKTGNITAFWINAPVSSGSFAAEDGTVVPYAAFDGQGRQFISNATGTDFSKITGFDHMTAEFWLKPQFESYKYPRFMYIGDNNNRGSSSWQCSMAPESNGNISVAVNNATVVSVTQAKSICKDWAHVVITRDIDRDTSTTSFNVYIDGVLKGNGTYARIQEDGGNVFFGGGWPFKDAAETYTGAIGAVRMYNTTLSADEVRAAYNAEAYLYQGSKLLDVDIANWDSTVSGEVNTTNIDKAGNVKKWNLGTTPPQKATFTAADGTEVPYIKFDGVTNQRIYIGKGEGSETLKDRDETTIELWAQMQMEQYKYPKLFEFAGSNSAAHKSLRCELTGDGTGSMGIYQYKDTIFNVTGLKKYNGKWCHIALTRKFNSNDTITYVLYLDGKKLGENTVSGNHTTVADPDNISFGANYWVKSEAECYKGGFGDIKMYSKVLSDSVIASHYNEKKDLFKTPEEDIKLDINFDNIPTISDNAGNAPVFWRSTELTADNLGTVDSKTYLKGDGTKNIFVGFGSSEAGSKAVLDNKNISLNFWVQTANSEKGQSVFSFGETDDANTSWRLQIEKGGLQQYVRDAKAGNLINLAKDEWTNVVVTRSYDESSLKATYQMYINGQLTDTFEKSLKTALNEKNVFFGGNFYRTTEMLDGGLAQVKVYGTVLPAAYIAKMYNDEKDTYIDSGILSVVSYGFEDEMGDEVSQISGNDTVNATFSLSNTSKKDKTYTAYAAIYDASGALKYVEPKNVTVRAGQENKQDYFEINTTAISENSSIKIFIWSDEVFMQPILTETFELPYTEAVRGSL